MKHGGPKPRNVSHTNSITENCGTRYLQKQAFKSQCCLYLWCYCRFYLYNLWMEILLQSNTWETLTDTIYLRPSVPVFQVRKHCCNARWGVGAISHTALVSGFVVLNWRFFHKCVICPVIIIALGEILAQMLNSCLLWWTFSGLLNVSFHLMN